MSVCDPYHADSGSHKPKCPRTEHGHVLLAVKVPVAPVGSVAMQSGVFLVVVGRLCAKSVNHTDVAPGGGQRRGAIIRNNNLLAFRCVHLDQLDD